jgi:uncharacterized protein YjcR
MAKQRVKITPKKLKKAYYVKHQSALQVAKLFNCSPTTIRNYLDKYGWRIRRQSEIMRGRKLSPEHRDKVVKNLPHFKGDKV